MTRDAGDRRLERRRRRRLDGPLLPLRSRGLRALRPGRSRRNLVTDPYSLALSHATARAARSWTWPTRRSSRRAGTRWRSRRSPRPRTSSSTSCTCATSASTTRPCPQALRGTFKAFTRRDVERHAAPARRSPSAGLTHVHLLPAFDIATIDEDQVDLAASPPGDLSSFPPDSEQQQAAVSASRGQRRLQLGLRPVALHRARGQLRHRTRTAPPASVEFREMVQALNRQRPARGDGRRLQPHQRLAARATSPCWTGSCPATTTASTPTATSRPAPAARTPPPSTP